MDVRLLLQQFQYAIPVGIVTLCAIIVYAFGFKNAEQPPFAQLSTLNDADRKQAGKKRSAKIKEKRSTNAQQGAEKSSPVKKVSPSKAESTGKKTVGKATEETDGKLKERRQDDDASNVVKNDKNQTAKSGKENKVEQKNKKNLKNLVLEKPLDFDDGDWEPAYSRKDKKNKKKEDETPSKKSKKNKKSDQLINENVAKEKDNERVEIKDKIAKETENKELKEKNQKDVVLEPIVIENVVVVVDENVEKKDEIMKIEKIEKEEKKVKSKKSKKISESENAPPSSIGPTMEKKPLEKSNSKKGDEAKKKPEPAEETAQIAATENENAPVFDELGDVWTEAKPQKKSKKKARKDN